MANSTEAASKGSNAGGRPTKFEKRFLEQVRKMALLGLTEPQMAGVLGVRVSTFHNWKKSQPGFLDAITQGKEVADANVAASLYDRACGYRHPEVVITSYQGEITKTRVVKHYPPDTQAASIWLRNRQPKLWRSQPDPADAGDEAPPPVQVTVEVRDARKPASDAQPQPSAV